MGLEKYCLKHPYIETEEYCVRCNSPLCPDCRIKEEEEPYCSSWCLYHDRASKAISSFTHGIRAHRENDSDRLVFISDMTLVLIMFFFVTVSFIFYEREKEITGPVIAKQKVEDEENKSAPDSDKTVTQKVAKISEENVLPSTKKIKTDKSNKPSPRIKKREVILRPANISRVIEAGKKLSITFDGGSNDSSAAIILDVLSEKKIKTTFFLTGKFIQRYPELVKRMLEEGHEIGNHTFSHPHLTTYAKNRKRDTSPGISFERLKKELDRTARLFRELTGESMAPFWRAPYGEINANILAWASKIGYQHIAWTVDYKARQSMDSLDWVADRNSSLYLSAQEIRERLLSFADDKGRARGGIILMHLGTERKEDAAHEKLAEIIDDFTVKGYKLVPVSQLVKVINEKNERKNL